MFSTLDRSFRSKKCQSRFLSLSLRGSVEREVTNNPRHLRAEVSHHPNLHHLNVYVCTRTTSLALRLSRSTEVFVVSKRENVLLLCHIRRTTNNEADLSESTSANIQIHGWSFSDIHLDRYTNMSVSKTLMLEFSMQIMRIYNILQLRRKEMQDESTSDDLLRV